MDHPVFVTFDGQENRRPAVALYTALVRQFGGADVFLDSIAPHDDDMLGRIRGARALVVILGPHGLAATGRLHRQLAAAFRAGVPVVPVLTDLAAPPAASDLPADLAPLSRCRSHRLRPDRVDDDLASFVANFAALTEPTLRQPRSADVTNTVIGGFSGVIVQTGSARDVTVHGSQQAPRPEESTDVRTATTPVPIGRPSRTEAQTGNGSTRVVAGDVGRDMQILGHGQMTINYPPPPHSALGPADVGRDGHTMSVTGISGVGVALGVIGVSVATARLHSNTWLLLGMGLSLVVCAAVLVVLVRAARRRANAERSLRRVLDLLRTTVLRRWSAEVADRGLSQPRPIRLRWHATQIGRTPRTRPRPTQPDPLRGALIHDVLDTRPAAQALVDAFRSSPRQQLVVLGPAGAGKTTLAILFALAAVHDTNPDSPVPIVLSVAGWRPPDPDRGTGERLTRWVAERIGEEYPRLANSAAALEDLWARGLLVPVLDGLDEIPDSLLALASTELLTMGARPMLITCRTRQFERVIRTGGALPNAALVEIQPVTAQDAATFLTQLEPDSPDLWHQVVAQLRHRPDGPLARALSTPLMISLARRVYGRPTANPSDLLAFTTAEQVTRHLLAQFLPSVYPLARDRERAQRWLGFLADHLRGRVGGPNLEWWRLARAVPGPIIATLIAVGSVLLNALLWPVLARVLGDTESIGADVLRGAEIGAVIGLLLGPPAARSVNGLGRVRRGRRSLAVLAAICRDIAGIATFLVGALAITIIVVRLHSAGAALHVTQTVLTYWWQFTTDFDNRLNDLLIAFAVLGVITMTNVLAVNGDGSPRRATPGPRRLVPSMAIGLGVGAAIGLPWVVIGMVGDPFNASLCFAVGATLAAIVGVPLGVGRWVASPVVTDRSHSPWSVLRADRTILLTAVAACGIVGGVSTGLVYSLTGEGPGRPAGVLIGFVIAVIVLLGSGSAWLSYLVARTWLALCGQLPWRLSRFLRAARHAEVLRQTGAAYQLRHDLLSNYLADQRPPATRARRLRETAATPAPRTRRAARRGLAIRAAVALLCVGTLVFLCASVLTTIYQDALMGRFDHSTDFAGCHLQPNAEGADATLSCRTTQPGITVTASSFTITGPAIPFWLHLVAGESAGLTAFLRTEVPGTLPALPTGKAADLTLPCFPHGDPGVVLNNPACPFVGYSGFWGSPGPVFTYQGQHAIYPTPYGRLYFYHKSGVYQIVWTFDNDAYEYGYKEDLVVVASGDNPASLLAWWRDTANL